MTYSCHSESRSDEKSLMPLISHGLQWERCVVVRVTMKLKGFFTSLCCVQNDKALLRVY